MRWRDAAVAALVAALAILAVNLPWAQRLDGLGIDVLFWLRHQAYGPLHEAADSPSAVIAIDEETFRRPPFQGVPKAMWTPYLARVITATLAGGAAVIGQDLILPTSVEARIRGYDRAYLIALREAARDGRVVLAKVQHQHKPISPFPGYSFAVGNERNIRLVNLFRDDDGVIRRIPLQFRSRVTDETLRTENSMALELAARTLGEIPVTTDHGVVSLAGYEIPGGRDNGMLVNFDGGAGAVPVYSFADLYACAEAGRGDFFSRHFDGRAVLLGTVLDVEDRKLTSKRLATSSDAALFAERCASEPMAGLQDDRIVRDTIPGVLVLAAAVNNVVRGDALRDLPVWAQGLLGLLVVALGAAATMLLGPWRAGLVLLAVLTLWIVAATVGFRYGLVLPLLDVPVAAGASFMILLAYRFAVADREKRAIRRAFAYYLPPPVVDRMVDSRQTPRLGGETRELTVMFSDLAGFTGTAEGMTPEAVVLFLNRYLSALTDVIEANGGFIEKFAGDGIVAVFGAPLPDPEHARHAVETALQCQERLAALAPALGVSAESVATRIGINSGPMLIGNIGSQRRFNYTVMGDAVNLAARLEGANKAFGTRILVSEETRALCAEAFAFREIGTVRVVGREAAVRLHEPLERAGELVEPRARQMAEFGLALRAYRAGRFDEAAQTFAALAADDPVARGYLELVQPLLGSPPAADWDGVLNLDRK